MDNFIAHFDAGAFQTEGPHPSQLLVSGSNGCTLGVTCCPDAAFGAPAVHEDQEGFVFVEGHGVALLDGKEYPVGPDTLMILQPGVAHAFKRAADSPTLRYFWFHAAAN